MKNNKGFTLIELLAIIIILGIIMAIAIPSTMKYTDNSKKKSAFVSVSNMIDSIKYNQDGECFYNYRIQDKDKVSTNFETLVIISYIDNSKQKYAVYAEIDKDVSFIDVNDFSRLQQNDNPNKWVLVDEKNGENITVNTASYYFDNYLDIPNVMMCSNIYEKE